MSDIELKPCPFCGSEASIATIKYSKDSDTAKLNKQTLFYFVSCNNEKLDGCGGNNQGLGGKLTKQDAIDAWNTRA